jgi:DNA-binding NtrC family response regulator
MGNNGSILDEIEKQVIAAVMNATEGNKLQTAKALRIYRPKLYNKLKKYGLSEPQRERGCRR